MSKSKISSLILAGDARLIQRNGIEGFNYYQFILKSESSTRESAARVSVGDYTTRTFTQETARSIRAALVDDVVFEGYTLQLPTKTQPLRAEFDSLVKQWKEETFPLSSLTKKYAHPAYQRIMAMGSSGIPLVLNELQKNNGRWFYALKFMAGKNVSEGIDNFEDAKAAWLEWGYKNNYI